MVGQAGAPAVPSRCTSGQLRDSPRVAARHSECSFINMLF